MTDCTTIEIAQSATYRPGLVARIRAAFQLARQRRALAEMDKAQLADLGLSPDAARAEAARPVWDVPANWKL